MSDSVTFADFLRAAAPAVLIGAAAGGVVGGRAVHLWHARRKPRGASPTGFEYNANTTGAGAPRRARLAVSDRAEGRQNACELCSGAGHLLDSVGTFEHCPRCLGSGIREVRL